MGTKAGGVIERTRRDARDYRDPKAHNGGRQYHPIYRYRAVIRFAEVLCKL